MAHAEMTIQEVIQETAKIEDAFEKKEYAACHGLWIDRDGMFVPIQNMGDKYLLNALRVMDRASEYNFNDVLMSAYGAASFLQGDMAQEAIWSEINAMESGHYCEYQGDEITDTESYNAIQSEVWRRGLKALRV